MTETRKLATILAVDIVGYSASAEHDQLRAAEHVKSLESRLSDLAEKHGGRIFNTAGDGFMLEFALASSAVRAAIELLSGTPEPDVEKPQVRAGAHLGEVITKGTDLLGHGVNVAARLMAAAQPDHLVISESLHAQLHGEVDASFDLLGPVRLNKMRESIVAYAYPPQRAGAARMRRLLAPVQRHWRTLSAVAAASAMALGAWYFTKPSRFELGALTTVAESRQPEIFPTLSPDGRFVVYTSRLSSGADLFMRPTAGGDETQLTETADSNEISAAFSPAGDQLAFVRARLSEEPMPPCDIVVRPFPEGLERRVGGCDTDPDTFRLSWSPDASSLIFSEAVEGSTFGTVRVRRLSIESGQTNDFIPPPNSGPGDFNAVFSPSGRYVAFVRYAERGVAQICAFDTRTQRVTVIMDGLAWAHLDWIDEDRIIAATRIRDTQNSVELWTLRRDGGARQRHLPTVAALERVDYANGVLAFQVRTQVQNLRRFEGGNHTTVTDANVEDHDADFSAQGALAYISGGAGEWIYLQQPGDPPRRFIETADAYGLRWSNDGRRLVYSGVSDGRRRLFITEVSSGVTRALDTPAGEEPINPAWGLDDRSLLYTGLSQRGARLYRLSLDAGAAPRPLSDYDWFEAIETADGVFARTLDRDGLWRLNENGAPSLVCGALRRAVVSRYSERDWHIANRRIYIIETDAEESARVLYCPIGGGPVRRILDVEAMVSGSLAVDPNTEAIVYAEIVHRQADIAIAQLARVN